VSPGPKEATMYLDTGELAKLGLANFPRPAGLTSSHSSSESKSTAG
jgi:hypothetical protein